MEFQGQRKSDAVPVFSGNMKMGYKNGPDNTGWIFIFRLAREAGGGLCLCAVWHKIRFQEKQRRNGE